LRIFIGRPIGTLRCTISNAAGSPQAARDSRRPEITIPLPDSYLIYPRRAYGSDQDRYAWRPRIAREAIAWPAGAPLAALVVIPLEFHRLNPEVKPFKTPGAMVTPYPDLRHYTSRDYGNRVGAYRLLASLKAAAVKATFPINAALLPRIRPLVDAIAADGHEIAAHGLAADALHWGGIDPATEFALVERTCDAFRLAGIKPRTWMSPARQQSFRTLDLIAEAGFDVCLDWESDTVPVPMVTTHGNVTAVPLSNELDDRLLLIERRQSENDWATQVMTAAQLLRGEAPRFGGQVLSFTLTPYIAGLPFRMHAVRQILECVGRDSGAWSATASEIADAAGPTAETP
jgi:allantoinase